MTTSTPPESTGKFTPEQRQRLGQVYAMILRWNREEDLLPTQQAVPAISSTIEPHAGAEFAEIIGRKG